MDPVCKRKSSVHPHVHLQWGQRVSWRQPRRLRHRTGLCALGCWIPVLERSWRERKELTHTECPLHVGNFTSVIPNSHSNSARSEVSEDGITCLGHTANDKSTSNPYLSDPRVQSLSTRTKVGKLYCPWATSGRPPLFLYYLWVKNNFLTVINK